MSGADKFVLAFILLIVAAAVYAAIAKNKANSHCLSAGFADVKGSPIIGFYCVKRVDQTDIVVPVGEVK